MGVAPDDHRTAPNDDEILALTIATALTTAYAVRCLLRDEPMSDAEQHEHAERVRHQMQRLAALTIGDVDEARGQRLRTLAPDLFPTQHGEDDET